MVHVRPFGRYCKILLTEPLAAWCLWYDLNSIHDSVLWEQLSPITAFGGVTPARDRHFRHGVDAACLSLLQAAQAEVDKHAGGGGLGLQASNQKDL